jgi:predicted amidohydrolase
VRVALGQMGSVTGDRDGNLGRAERMLREAAGRADLLCLPEMMSTGYDLDGLRPLLATMAEEVPDGPTVRRLAACARALDIAVVAGLLERDPHVAGLLYDTAVLIDRRGELVGRYRKSHLYPAEHRLFRSGDELPVFVVDGLRVGVAMCFEAAFPPIFSTLGLRGAELVLSPSAVPVGFEHLLRLRTRARAQDNQLFVATVNQVGEQGGVRFCGESQVADPRGEVVAAAPAQEEALTVAELDLTLIDDQRLQEPVYRGFRPRMYELPP